MERLIRKKNVLLLKDDIGKGKPASIKLPPVDVAYGRPNNKNEQGCSVITTSWLEHTSSKQSLHMGQDWKKRNKYGIHRNRSELKDAVIPDGKYSLK